jgi:hypothetical protein
MGIRAPATRRLLIPASAAGRDDFSGGFEIVLFGPIVALAGTEEEAYDGRF